MEVLNSLPPGALAALVAHGFFTQGLVTNHPPPPPPPPSFNLGRAIAEFKGTLFTGTLDEVLSHWFRQIEDAFKLWKVPKNERAGFASAFLGGSAKEWFFQEDSHRRQKLLMKATGDEVCDEEDYPGFQSWEELKEALAVEFAQDELVDESIAQLFGLCMTGPLADYHQQLEVICGRIPEELLPERVKMVAFKTGLHSATAMALKAATPRSHTGN